MIVEPSKLTIRRPSRRPTSAQIAAFQDVPTGFVVDALGGTGALDAAIKPLAPTDLPGHVAGPALTAGNGPADIMATLAALAFLQDGDVLVAAFAGHQGCAASGDRVSGMAKNGGASGFVTDGPMRDYAGVVAVGLPCWCTGLTPATPYSSGPGSVGLPVQIGGQKIETGDMIVADRDGVVIVPFDRLDAVIERLSSIHAMEAARDAEVAGGLAVPDDVRAWLDSDLVTYVD
jgi:4-hydroxy-4-methyl-2-oxoglutarate aldolase